MSDRRIEKIRSQIDAVDDQLLRLLSQRASLVVDLAWVKRELGMQVFDPERERQILARVTGANVGPLTHEAVSRLFERIIDESRRLERTEVYDKQE